MATEPSELPTWTASTPPLWEREPAQTLSHIQHLISTVSTSHFPPLGLGGGAEAVQLLKSWDGARMLQVAGLRKAGSALWDNKHEHTKAFWPQTCFLQYPIQPSSAEESKTARSIKPSSPQWASSWYESNDTCNYILYSPHVAPSAAKGNITDIVFIYQTTIFCSYPSMTISVDCLVKMGSNQPDCYKLINIAMVAMLKESKMWTER